MRETETRKARGLKGEVCIRGYEHRGRGRKEERMPICYSAARATPKKYNYRTRRRMYGGTAEQNFKITARPKLSGGRDVNTDQMRPWVGRTIPRYDVFRNTMEPPKGKEEGKRNCV